MAPDTAPTDGDPAMEAARIKAIEDRFRALRAAHVAVWGDGPPYFSGATTAFWQALSEGRFDLSRCGACGHVHFPPRVVCPACWATDAGEPCETTGAGRLVTVTELHVVSPALRSIAPVCLAVVDLDEGVRVLTWLRGATPDTLRVGDRCHIAVETILDRPWFVGRPGPPPGTTDSA